MPLRYHQAVHGIQSAVVVAAVRAALAQSTDHLAADVASSGREGE